MQPNLRLKRERERRGWSQAKVARELGIDPRSVSRWEHGQSRPYPYFREKLCLLFGLDTEALGLLDANSRDVGEQSAQSPHAVLASPSTTLALPPQSAVFDPFIPLPGNGAATLVGRAFLLQGIKQRLLSGEPGGVTLLRGLPGVGKTTLASVLAHDPEVQAFFHDGILWAGLGPQPQVSAHLGRWCKLLACEADMRQLGDAGALMAALRLRIGHSRMLLIIDDAWELESVLALRVGGAACAYLVTTRIPQLTHYFAPEESRDVLELSEEDSLRLLAHFVPQLVSSNLTLMRELIEAVGGLPLALTLLGKHLRAQLATGQPRRLSAALEQVCDPGSRLRLSLAAFVNPPAQVSLYTVIHSSEQYLDAEAQRVLRALSIFPAKPNSFSEEAALAVSRASVESLDRLSDLGLLESPEPRRYTLHQTIADYARLQPSEDADLAQRRFVAYMVRYAEEYSALYALLEREYQNIISALLLAKHAKMKEEYVRGVTALASFLMLRGLGAQAIEQLQQARQFVQDEENACALLPILAQLGSVARQQGRLAEAEAYLQEGLLYARRQGNDGMISTFLYSLAEVAEQRDDTHRAYAYLHEEQNLDWHQRYKQWTLYQRGASHPAKGHAHVYFTEPHELMQRGAIADIDAFFRSWKYADAFSPALLDIVTGPGKHIYGVPSSAYKLGLVYNRKLFREAGLDPDRPPTTWDEFRTAARLLTDQQRGMYGFAETTMRNMGGWHFTNWLYTAGVRPQIPQQGAWQAAFNHPKAVQFLEMLQQMRFVDRSMPDHILLSTVETNYLFLKGEVAMIIGTPETIVEWYNGGLIARDDIGLAAMPQNGGNACLMGGTAYVFHAQSTPPSLQASFEEFMAARFHLDDYEIILQNAARARVPIGLPEVSLFADSLQRELDELTARYANLPREHYRQYTQSTLTPVLEPPIAAQKYYALLDPVIQSVLANPGANPQSLLDLAVEQFQQRFLNAAASALLS